MANYISNICFLIYARYPDGIKENTFWVAKDFGKKTQDVHCHSL